MNRAMLEGRRASPDFNADPDEETEEFAALTEEERLRAQHNKAAAVSAALQGLIGGRKKRGGDHVSLEKVLQKAEKKKERLRAKLAKFGADKHPTFQQEKPL
jgi:hypothetical protein